MIRLALFLVWLSIGGLTLAPSLPAHADEHIPEGKGSRGISLPPHMLKVFTYRSPTHAKNKGPLLLVFHGYSRNPEKYRDHGVSLADRLDGLVVAPFFDETQFPGQACNHGKVLVDGVVQPREAWTFSVVPRLIEHVRILEGRADMPYYLLGHSGGGQFVERLMALTELKPIRAVAANPGSHLFPGADLAFPYGFGNLPAEVANDKAQKAYLTAPLTLYLGTPDTDPDDPVLDNSKPAKLQGPHRLARGRKCFDLARELAQAKGWDFNWRMIDAPNVGHSAGQMFTIPACVEALLGGRAKTEGELK